MTKGTGVLLPYIKPDVYCHRPQKHIYLPIPKGMFIKIKGSRKTVRLVFLRLSSHKEIIMTKESIDYTLKLTACDNKSWVYECQSPGTYLVFIFNTSLF